MNRSIAAAAALLAAGAALMPGRQDADPQRVRRKLKDNDLAGRWFYDDVEAGFRAAREEGKPMLLVFRCVP